jgi:hypothetical protein
MKKSHEHTRMDPECAAVKNNDATSLFWYYCSGEDISKIITNIFVNFTEKSRDSSVGIAIGYGLDDQNSRVRFLARAENFSLHHRVQNGCGAHPDSYPTVASGSFPGDEAAGACS